MKTQKNYQIRISSKGCENTFASVNGKTEKSALAAAKRLYPSNDYDYALWYHYENGEYGFENKIR